MKRFNRNPPVPKRVRKCQGNRMQKKQMRSSIPEKQQGRKTTLHGYHCRQGEHGRKISPIHVATVSKKKEEITTIWPPIITRLKEQKRGGPGEEQVSVRPFLGVILKKGEGSIYSRDPRWLKPRKKVKKRPGGSRLGPVHLSVFEERAGANF